MASEEYEEGNEESLVPDEPQADWPDEMEAYHGENENFLRFWMTADEEIGVLMDAGIEPTIEDAENHFDRRRSTARSPNEVEYDLVDEAILSDDGEAATFAFRHSNAIGSTVALRMAGLEIVPDRNRARAYGEILMGHWGIDE